MNLNSVRGSDFFIGDSFLARYVLYCAHRRVVFVETFLFQIMWGFSKGCQGQQDTVVVLTNCTIVRYLHTIRKKKKTRQNHGSII